LAKRRLRREGRGERGEGRGEGREIKKKNKATFLGLTPGLSAWGSWWPALVFRQWQNLWGGTDAQ
jgi:hypothetical protein